MDAVSSTSDSSAAFATAVTPSLAVPSTTDDFVATGSTDGFEPARANVVYLGTVTSLSQLAMPDVLQDTAGWDDRNRGLGSDVEHARTSSHQSSDEHHHAEAQHQNATKQKAAQHHHEAQHQRVTYALSSSPHLELRGAEPTIESGAVSDLAAFTSGAVTTNDRGIEA